MNELRRGAATAALLLLTLIAACTDAASGAGEPAPLSPPTEEPAALPPIRVDWAGPTVATTDLPGGWVLADCEGDAPLLCVTSGGDLVGTVSSGRWSSASAVTDPPAFLRRQLDEHLAAFAADRATVCGPGYRYGLDGLARDVTVDGAPGLRYDLVGTDASGVIHERSMTTTLVVGTEVVYIAAVASDPDGCMGGENPGEFTPADLQRFAPWYAAMITGSTVGEQERVAATVGDGAHQGRVRLQGSTVTVDTVRVLSGEPARQAAVAAGVLGEGEDLPNDVFVDDRDATTWTLALDGDATVEVFDCSGGCELVRVSLDDLRAGTAAPLNGELAIFDLTVEAGRITALSEVYLP